MTGSRTKHPMTEEEKEQLAQEHFGKSYEDLDTNQKRAVGGFGAQQHRHTEEGEEEEKPQAAMPKAHGGHTKK